MTSKLATLICVLLFNGLSFAQKSVDVPMEKGEVPLGFVDLKDYGFIIKTGKIGVNAENLQWQLSHYTPTLDLVWKVPVAASPIMNGNAQDIITNPSGSYVYQLEDQRNSGVLVTQIDKSGQTKSFDIDKATRKQMKGEEEVRLCDEQSLYIATLFRGNKRIPTQLFLNTFSHQDFSFSQRIVDLPVIDVGKSTAQWEYAGHSAERLWLVSKSVAKDRDAYQCQLVAVDWQGKIAKKIVLNHQVANAYLRASRSRKYCPGAKLMRSGSVTTRVNMSHMSGMPHTIHRLGIDAWANVLVDESNGTIYTYGLLGKNKSQSRGAYVEGYYLAAYDMQGQQQWQQQSTEDDPMLTNRQFCRRMTNDQRNIFAQPIGRQGFRLQISSFKDIYTYEFSSDGKKLADYHSSTRDLQAQVSPNAPHYVSSSSQGDVLIKYNGSKLSLLRQ